MKGIPAFPCMPLFYRGMRCAGLAGICLFLLGACHTDTLYHVYQAVPGEKGWNKSDSLIFTLPPEVAAGTYGMEIGIRHTGGYPYRDIWLSVTQVEGEDSLASHTDTLHIYLADEKGPGNSMKVLSAACISGPIHVKTSCMAHGFCGAQFEDYPSDETESVAWSFGCGSPFIFHEPRQYGERQITGL